MKFEHDTRRNAATRRIMKAMARISVHEPLPVTLEDGSSPLVVVLPDDSVTSLVERVNRVGGNANVAVAEDEQFVILAMSGGKASRTASDAARVHRLSTVGMLVAWLETQPTGAGAFSMNRAAPNARESLPVKEHSYSF